MWSQTEPAEGPRHPAVQRQSIGATLAIDEPALPRPRVTSVIQEEGQERGL